MKHRKGMKHCRRNISKPVRPGEPEAAENQDVLEQNIKGRASEGRGMVCEDAQIGSTTSAGRRADSLVVTIEDLEADLYERLREAGAPEATIYAMSKTGLFALEGLQHLMTDAEIDAWNAAIDEYETLVN